MNKWSTVTGICSYVLGCDFVESLKTHTSAFLKITLELLNFCFLLVFPPRGVLKYQTNIEAHPPGCLRANQSTEQRGEELEQAEDEERRCREEAHFQPHCPQVCVCVCVGGRFMSFVPILAFQFILCMCSRACKVCGGGRCCTCVLSIWEVMEGVGLVY